MAREQKSIKKNTIYNMLKTFSSIIFPLITFPYVSRVLSPVGIGQYNFSNTYVGYFSLIASLGITTYAIRECAAVRDDQEKLDKVSSQIFSINICTMLIAYAALFISLVFFRKLDSYRILIIIFSSNILFTIVGADWINSAFEDFRYITLRTFGMQFISLICIFIFVRKPSDVLNYALITVLASGGANILNMFYRRRFCKMRFIRDMGWKKHFPSIMLLFVMLLAQTILSSTDITMLGLMKTDAEVGLYSTAVKMYNIISQVVSSVLWVLMPRLSVAFSNKDYSEVNILLRRTFQFMLALALPCTIGVGILADPIISIVGGSAFSASASYLRILMAASFVAVMGGGFFGNIILLPSHKEKYFMQACLIAAGVNFILNYIFIPQYGGTAAGISTVIAHVIIGIYTIHYRGSEISMKGWLKDSVPLFAGSVFVIIDCLLLKLGLGSKPILWCLASIVTSSAGYFLILSKMHHVLAEEVFVSIKNRIGKK